MRASIKIVLSLAFAASVAGCGALQEANQVASDAKQAASDVQQFGGKVQTCIDAVNIVQDLSSLNPSEAVVKAQAKATELQELAKNANDTNVADTFNNAATALNQLANKPEEAQSIIKAQVDLVKNACS